MAKSKTVRMGEYEYTEAELDAMHKLAVERGKETLRTEPRAARAYYDAGSDRLVIDLTNGATFMVPRRLVQGLSDAPPELVAEVEIMDKFGLSLHWQKLDADFSVGGLVRGSSGRASGWPNSGGRAGAQPRRPSAPPHAPTAPAAACCQRPGDREGRHDGGRWFAHGGTLTVRQGSEGNHDARET